MTSPNPLITWPRPLEELLDPTLPKPNRVEPLVWKEYKVTLPSGTVEPHVQFAMVVYHYEDCHRLLLNKYDKPWEELVGSIGEMDLFNFPKADGTILSEFLGIHHYRELFLTAIGELRDLQPNPNGYISISLAGSSAGLYEQLRRDYHSVGKSSPSYDTGITVIGMGDLLTMRDQFTQNDAYLRNGNAYLSEGNLYVYVNGDVQHVGPITGNPTHFDSLLDPTN